MRTFGRPVFCEVGTQPVGKTEFSTGKKSPRLHYIKRGLLLDDFHRSSFLNGILAVVLYQNFYSIIIFFAWPSVFSFNVLRKLLPLPVRDQTAVLVFS